MQFYRLVGKDVGLNTSSYTVYATVEFWLKINKDIVKINERLFFFLI